MFTGIVQAQVKVRDLTKRDGFLRLTLDAGSSNLQQLQRGASIAVNGTCLTATEFDIDAGWVSFDVIDETLIKTNLGTLQPGSKVNFERSLKFGDEIGGHIVSGHVSATAEILTIKRSDDNCAMQLSFPAELAPYIQPKGFIAIDGASLTVGAVEGHSFWLHLIPETLAITTLGNKQVGDRLNLEPATAQPVSVGSMPAAAWQQVAASPVGAPASSIVLSPALSVYLDVLRLFAALLVFAHHAAYERFDGSWISPLAGYGHDAVVIFFVLSGFVIAFVQQTKERTAMSYGISRVSRLVSVAWPAVLATILLDSVGRLMLPELYEPAQPLHAALHSSLLFTNEFWVGGMHVGSNIPLWSLSFEAAYYLLFAVFMFSRHRWLWCSLAALVIGPKILLLLPAWLAGVWVYRYAATDRSRPLNMLMAFGGAAFVLLMVVGKVGNLYINWRVAHWLGPQMHEFFGHSSAFVTDYIIALGFAVHLVGMTGLLRQMQVRQTVQAMISRLSGATFPLYVFHYPALYCFTALSVGLLEQKVGVLIGILALGFSWLMTAPCEKLRSYLRRKLLALFLPEQKNARQ